MAIVESFSGIRGIFGSDLDEDSAIRYAHSFLTLIRKETGKSTPSIVIGRDTRHSGGQIMDSIMGILDCNFINVGIASTPCVEFSVRYFNADGGIMLTASHNEPEWNGFKFLGKDGSVLKPKEMQQVIDGKKYLKNFHKINIRKVLDKGKEAYDEYSRFALEIIGKENITKIRDSGIKIIIDPNGGTGTVAGYVLEKAKINFASVNIEQGVFKRKIEPTKESLFFLSDEIKKHKADFAVGFDCDADRAEIILPSGEIVSGNDILALIVDYYLSKGKKNTIVVNDATSGSIRKICKKYCVKLAEVEVGETNVVSEMEKRKSIIGGEGSSGGVIIPPSKCRDGILSMLAVLSICANKNKKLEGVIEEIPKFYNLRAKVPFDEKNHDNIKKKLKEHYAKYEQKETGGIKGGLKIIMDEDSFVWFRASKTEGSVFRVIADSDDKQKAEKILKNALTIFENANR